MTEKLLVLQWDEENVVALEGAASRGGLRVEQYLTLPWPEAIDVLESPQEMGAWLREQLDAAGIRARRCILLVSRNVASLKQVELPAASDEELPQLVHFQAEGRSAIPFEELCVDFLPLPSKDQSTGRQVVLATVRKSLVTAYRQLAAAANLNVESLGLSSVAVMEVVLRDAASAEEGQLRLVVVPGERTLELIFAVEDCLKFSHVKTLLPEETMDAEMIVATVRRVLISAFGPLAEPTVDEVLILGASAEATGWESLLTEELECSKTRVVDPFDTVELCGTLHRPETPGSYAAALGALLAAAQPSHPTIDFLHPRRPVVKKPRGKLKAALALAVVVLLGVFGWVTLDRWEKDLDESIRRLSGRQRDLKRLLERAEPAIQTATLVEEWTAGRVNCLDELLTITQEMPQRDRTYVSILELTVPPHGGPARLSTTGYARDRKDVMELNERMLKMRHRFEIQPHGIHPSRKDRYYPWRFELEALITKRDKPTSVRAAKELAPHVGLKLGPSPLRPTP